MFFFPSLITSVLKEKNYIPQKLLKQPCYKYMCCNYYHFTKTQNKRQILVSFSCSSCFVIWGKPHANILYTTSKLIQGKALDPSPLDCHCFVLIETKCLLPPVAPAWKNDLPVHFSPCIYVENWSSRINLQFKSILHRWPSRKMFFGALLTSCNPLLTYSPHRPADL